MFEKIKELVSNAHLATAVASTSYKPITDSLIIEIFDDQWGSGDTRKKKLIKAGYDYDAVQKRVTEVAKHMRTRREAMQPWYDACKAQQEWSYNARYNWGKWKKTIASSKDYGTCITYPSVVAMRAKLIKEGKYITSSGSDHDSQSTLNSFWSTTMKSLASINKKYWSSIKYPNKTTAQLVKEGKIKEGDIIGFMGHTSMYAGKKKDGTLLFNNAGHAAGIYGDKPGSNRAVLNQKSSYMTKRLVYGVFSVNTFIVMTSCINGTITYSNRYMAGQDAVITIKPNAGCVVKSIKVDGKTVKAKTTYTISKIDAHHIVEVICDSGTMPTKTPYTGEYPVVKKYLEYGDKGAEVTKLQNYLNWYTDGEFFDQCGKADGIYGNNTLKYTNEMLTDFFGAKEADGKVGVKTIAKMKAYSDSFKPTPTPTPIPSGKYTGEIPTLRLIKSNAQVKADACAWASWIAGDNRFHYGHGQHAHHNGCYFCGTQKMKMNHGIVDPEFTYCCNPFVGAVWAHGGCIPKALSMCQDYSSWDFNKGHGYDASSLFDKLGHPAKSKLKAGDVLCNGRHVALYLGDGKLAEASGGDDNKKNSTKWNNSIHVITMSDSKYNSFDRVYRYNGKVDADIVMRHGECSDRVMQWQKFLDWYFDGEFTKQCGAPDRFFGDNTLKWTKKFQEKEFGKKEADGLCGNKTFGRAKEITK